MALAALTAFLIGGFAGSGWATGEIPPSTPCVDVEKTCLDAGSTADPITFEVTLLNCGDVQLYCNVKDLITHEILINGPVAPGEVVLSSGSYHPAECGESTNEVKAQCTYQVVQGTNARIYDADEAVCSVPCDGEEGCTLTPGYWKTHSVYGPAPYDLTWAIIGEDTPFFLSGISFYEALWTEPEGGNAYFILAHPYIAAQLNLLNGALIPSDVEVALGAATDLLEVHTPAAIGALSGKDELRKEFVRAAGILDGYNNGLVGPGHCEGEIGAED
jgi:hypothetical protein